MAKDDNKYSREEQARRTRSAEVGANGGLDSKNPMSSAKGPYQILDSTWKDMEKTAGKKLDRKNLEDNELAFQLYTKRSEKTLEQNGLEVNPGNTYALHVYGTKGGVDFLKRIKADPDGLAIDGMSKEVINGNKPFFYDENGKPRTNKSSYDSLSSRVGGPSDPGAITLQKNLEKEQYQQAQQEQTMAQQANQQASQEEYPEEEVQEEEVPEEVQEEEQVMNQAPPQETSRLSQASNRAGMVYNGSRSSDKFILPEEPIQEDIKTSGESVQKMKTFAYGGVSSVLGRGEPKKNVATRQDSLDVKNDSERILNDYLKRGYKPTNVKFPNETLDETNNRVLSKKGTREIIRGNIRNTENYDPTNFRTNIDENKFRQRESADGVMNMDVDPALYDKRIQPTGYTRLMGAGPGTYNDGVNIPSYADMEVGKKSPVVKKSIDTIPTVKKIKQHESISPVVTLVKDSTSQKKPFKLNKDSLEFTGEFTRDNTRVGRSYTGIDPSLVRKANSSNYAYGGRVGSDNTMHGKDDGLLNEFNAGGSHEENPNGGILQGVSKDGSSNSVEEGETRMGDYIFSNRLSLDKKDVENLYLPRETEGMTYAEASKFINSFLTDNPFDHTVKKTATSQLESLKIGNDRAKRYKEEEDALLAEDEVKRETAGNPALQSAVLSQMNIQSSSSQEEMIPNAQSAFGGYLASRKMWGGGSTNTDDEIDTDESEDTSTGGFGKTGAIVGAAGTGFEMGMDAFKKFDSNNVHGPDIGKAKTGANIGTGAIKGATAGAMFGPIGAGVGALVGAGLGWIGSSRQNKAANKQAINKSDYAFNMLSKEIPENDVFKNGGNMKKYALGSDTDPIRGYRYKSGSFNPYGVGNGFLATNGNQFIDTDSQGFVPGSMYSPNVMNQVNSISNATKGFGNESKYSKMFSTNVDEIDRSVESNDKQKDVDFKMKGNNILQYADSVGALSNYLQSRNEKPRVVKSEQYSKTSSPKYYDESFLTTQLGKEANNIQQTAMATSGGSAANARATTLQGMSALNKLRGESYFKMDEVNRGVYDKDQSESQRINDMNVNIRNQDYQANLQEADYLEAKQQLYKDNLIKSVSNIGREQSDRNLIYNITGGYNTNGTYDPESKIGLWNQAMDLTKKVRGKANGGLVDIYRKANTLSEREQAIENFKRKYNGKI